ncbi:uncharacterized protein LOC135359076 [Latimeria chalumnae]|uniref:uncharacterized protein LOC135359076 n=1 Tax=Latimeria chalumnae TaxID=7897 RepID=UPI00313AAA96
MKTRDAGVVVDWTIGERNVHREVISQNRETGAGKGWGGQSLAWKPKGPKAETVMAHTTGRGYYLTGEIEGIPCRFLVDSGAQVSVAHLQLWKNVTGKGPEDLTPFNGVINVANGGELQVLGTWRTMISLGNLQLACEFLVSEEATQDVLVGTDFLKQYGAALDFRECTCTLLGRKFALMTGEDVGLCQVSGTALTLEASQLVRNSKNEVEETESLSMKDCQRADSQLSRLRGWKEEGHIDFPEEGCTDPQLCFQEGLLVRQPSVQEEGCTLMKWRQEKATGRQKVHYDLRATAQVYKEGELVWVKNQTRKKGISPKPQRKRRNRADQRKNWWICPHKQPVECTVPLAVAQPDRIDLAVENQEPIQTQEGQNSEPEPVPEVPEPVALQRSQRVRKALAWHQDYEMS